METELFKHTYFSNEAVDDMQSHQTLHIYIEGDGTPWINGQWIAKDPTPRKAVMLELMRIDNSPAILLGRPCYHRQVRGSNCDADDWTTGRYSANVIRSMVDAIDILQDRLGFSEVVLFGHSGGGVIALLIANSLKQETTKVTTVVTLAANIDTDAWATSHRYLPLKQSINPTLLPALPSSIAELHLFGKNDQVVDFTLFKNYLSSRAGIESIVYDGFDHNCCWNSVWPQILEKIQ